MELDQSRNNENVHIHHTFQNGVCLFDGGDCCGSDVNTDFCTLCICYEDLNCGAPMELIGNGLCNDEANNAECNYDGGDCCGACVNTEYCTECVCHEGEEPAIDLSCKWTSHGDQS